MTNQIPPIYVKQFKHIPMAGTYREGSWSRRLLTFVRADLDVVFPDKHVHMTTLDRLIFGVGIVLGIYLILSELFSLLFAEPEEVRTWGWCLLLNVSHISFHRPQRREPGDS